MIGLDTNVLVRFLTQDHAAQAAIANALIQGLTPAQPGFVSSVVLAEITWVLSRDYKAPREDVARAVEGLLRAAELRVGNASAAYRALAAFRASTAGEFTDALIAQTAALAGAKESVIFNRAAANAFGMRLLA